MTTRTEVLLSDDEWKVIETIANVDYVARGEEAEHPLNILKAAIADRDARAALLECMYWDNQWWGPNLDENLLSLEHARWVADQVKRHRIFE